MDHKLAISKSPEISIANDQDKATWNNGEIPVIRDGCVRINTDTALFNNNWSCYAGLANWGLWWLSEGLGTEGQQLLELRSWRRCINTWRLANSKLEAAMEESSTFDCDGYVLNFRKLKLTDKSFHFSLLAILRRIAQTVLKFLFFWWSMEGSGARGSSKLSLQDSAWNMPAGTMTVTPL